MKSFKKEIWQSVKLVLLALVLSISISYVFAWTGPTATAPNSNTPAPINVSATSQVKSGGLGVTNLVADSVTVGSTVNTNSITAPQFCLGMACITEWPTARTPSMQIFTSSGTWTKPAGVTKVRVRLVGGGGGGGPANVHGPGGGYCEKLIDVSLISSVSVTIGAGGAGQGGNNFGSPGGTSSFGSHCAATGGNPTGKIGGIGSGGDLNSSGSWSGSSVLGGSSNVYGATGGNYGVGGIGPDPDVGGFGGAGAPGVVVVEEY